MEVKLFSGNRNGINENKKLDEKNKNKYREQTNIYQLIADLIKRIQKSMIYRLTWIKIEKYNIQLAFLKFLLQIKKIPYYI